MPDVLIYRVGPQPGRPIKCLMRGSAEKDPSQGVPVYVPDVRNNREGPQVMEPSKCLNGQSYGERQAKEVF